jgi:O-antigen/teichoic acid export membrane protein
VATSAALNLLFTIALTPLFGITGTALATLAATVYRVAALLLAAKRELRVRLLG